MIVRVSAYALWGAGRKRTSNLFPPFFRRTMDTFVNLEHGGIRECLCGGYAHRLDLIRWLVDRH